MPDLYGPIRLDVTGGCVQAWIGHTALRGCGTGDLDAAMQHVREIMAERLREQAAAIAREVDRYYAANPCGNWAGD